MYYTNCIYIKFMLQIKEQQTIIKAYAMEKMKEIDPIERPDETIDETRVEV